MVKRTLRAMVVGYVVLGVATLALERAGVYRCGCDPDCWCKRPGLNVFRWVLPRWHKGTPGMHLTSPTLARWKEQFRGSPA